MPRVLVDGRTIAYERAGEGAPVVLLHGIGSNARSWRHQLSSLADAFTVIAWDAPGYGGSDDPPETWRMADFAACLNGFLEALDIPRAHLVGLSWGGVLAQEFYRWHPERVWSLVLADTNAGHGSLPPAERERRLHQRLAALATMTPHELGRSRAPQLVSPNASPELVVEVATIMGQIRPGPYRTAAIALSEADERDVLARIRVPTLVLCGALDRVTPLEEVRAVYRAIPGAAWAVIPEAGHVSNQEQPERFNTVVRRFLESAVSLSSWRSRSEGER
jgi:pimeloyl-ACP methyl ester carboxylesterase